MAGPAYRRLSCCGPKCSICCTILSIFCVFFSVIWGALFYTGQDMVRRGVGLALNYKQIGTACFGSAVVYVFFIACCSCQYWLRQRLIKDEMKMNEASASLLAADAAAASPAADQQ